MEAVADSGSILSSSFVDESIGGGVVGLVVSSLVFGAALLVWFKKDDGTTNAKSNSSEAADVVQKSTIDKTTNEGAKAQPLRNVFSVRQKPIITGSKTSSKQKASDERPFESSYYFAHNKHSTG